MNPAVAHRRAAALSAVVAIVAVTSCSGRGPSATPRAATQTTTTTATTATTATSGPAASRPTASTPPTTAPAGAGPCGTLGPPPVRYQHVLWLWMENHTWPQVLGDPAAAPYLTGLAHQCATATRYASVGSPSLPNYLGATSGDTYGIGDDNGPSAHPLTADNLFRQVRVAGGTERSYEESMGPPCRQDSTGDYAVKHNPAAYYVGAADRAACLADDIDFNALSGDLAAGTLPTFAFITPNLCHDTHDCGVATGDAWLRLWVPRLLASPAYQAGGTAIFIVWDEYTPMPNVTLAPAIRTGTSTSVAFSHYSLLRTTEELLGLPLLGLASTAASMRGPLRL